jgi:hypothetical protein
MPFAKGKSGNPGGRATEKLWRDSILKAVKERDGKKGPQFIEMAAQALVTAAIAGDVPAIKELGDRLDGKSAPSPEEREDTKALIVQLVKYRAE